MAVRFKFRSSATFDSVDLQGRPSISVLDLKSKIVLHKHLSLCHDFDLVLSDSVTGQEYHDESFQIQSGSSVIVKRVPAGSTPSVMPHNGLAEKVQTEYAYSVNTSHPMVVVQEKNVEVDDFDDFGIDLCPAPDTALFNSNLDIDKGICSGSEKNNIAVHRCSDLPIVRCQKLESSDLSDAISRGPLHLMEGKTLQIKSRTRADEQMTSEKVVKADPPPIQTVDLPSELKCSLCATFFKNAVMIPCCQHSFCEECIRNVLVEEARCPKCSGTKCGVQDLLPNISLRQAIEHFLESQILATGSENGFHRYAPDGESGIQAKEVSCAASVTRRGSNQMGESAYDYPCKNLASTSRVKHSDIKSEREGFETYSDFQGESQPVQEEADSTIKRKKGLWVDTAGGAKSLLETGRHRKGDRTCYTCGSPDHLKRDCPEATNLHPMFQTGNAMFPRAMPSFAQPYWNGSPMARVPPFPNPYSYPPGMMHFNAAMPPAATFSFPTYMPYMYGAIPPFGFTRPEGAGTPRGTNAGGRVSYSEFLDLQNSEKEWKLLNDKRRREQQFDDDDDDNNKKRSRYKEAERSFDRKSHTNRGKSHSCSEDSSTHVLGRKHYQDVHLDTSIHSVDAQHVNNSRPSVAGRDQKEYYRPERSSSDVDDMPSSSVCHDEEKYKHHDIISKMHSQKTERLGNDSGRSLHQSTMEKDVRRKRVESNRQNQKHHNSSESGLEPSSSDHLKQPRKKGSSHSSRRSKHDVSTNNEARHDRWHMIPQSVDGGEDNYQLYRQRRVHYKSKRPGF